MIFIDKINVRVQSSKDESDVAYFYDVLNYGEFLAKVIALYLVSLINDDKDRTRYREEYSLVRANSVGDFAQSIERILIGPANDLINPTIREYELDELVRRSSSNDWQYQAQVLLSQSIDAFSISHDKLPTKSPLRNWFSAFAYFRNKTKGHGAPTVECCSKASPLLDQAINIIISNFTAFKRPWVYLRQNLNGKYRVSTISKKGGDYFDDLKKSSNHSYDDGVYCFVGGPKKINLFYSNSELSDFYISNGNLKNNEFECISYITNERIYQDANNFMGPINLLPSSLTEGDKCIDVVGNSFTNLPKPVDEYISRPVLEEELESVLNEKDRFPIITLLGRGGIGKTSLALNVIKKIAKKDRFDLIIWFSSRDIDLLVDGPKQVQTKVLNQKDIACEFYSVVDPDNKISDKTDLFSKEMTCSTFGKALYVFDNFETLTNPLEVYEWINTYIRNPNKVLITSRISRNFKADFPIEVGGMSESESKDLIGLFAKKLQITDLLTASYIDEIIEESDGHPYIIKILLGEIAKNNKLSKIERIIADQEKILSALFKRTFYSLTPAAKRVFLTLCSWNAMIPVIAIEAVLWRPENEKMNVSAALEELRKSSFIDFIYSNSESIISVPLAASIYGKSELEVYPEKIKIHEDRKLLMEFGVIRQTNISAGIMARVEDKFKAVANRITSIEQFKNEIPTLEYIATKFPKAYLYISKVFEDYDDYEMTKYYLREYLKTSVEADQKAKIWFKLADVCRSSKDWEGESHALSELVIINAVPFEKISEAANRINNYFYYHPDERKVDYKKALLDKIINVMKIRIDEGDADDYSRLGWLLINNDKNDMAQEIVLKGLKLDETNSHCLKLLHKLEGLY